MGFPGMALLSALFLVLLSFAGCVQVEGGPPEEEVDTWTAVTSYDELTGLWRAVDCVTTEFGEYPDLPSCELSFTYTVELAYPAGDRQNGIETGIIIDFEQYADFRAQTYIDFLYPQGLPSSVGVDLFKESLWKGVQERESGDTLSFEGYTRVQRIFTEVSGASYPQEEGGNSLFINAGGNKLKQTRPVHIDIDEETLFAGERELVFFLMVP
jgi:hypothetical protein